MKSSVSTILSEIFEYDPTLRFKESEIRSYLEILLKNKPEVKASPELISSLKFKLMNSISPPPKSTINWKSILAGFLGGGAAVSFAAYGLWNTEILSVAPPWVTPLPKVTSTVVFAPEKIIQSKESFGKIALANTQSAAPASSQNIQKDSRDPRIAESSPVWMTTPVTASIAPSPTISARVKSISPTTKIASDTTAIEAPTVSSDSKMMSPDMMPYMPIEYVYSYTGSLGTIPKEMNVFRKKIESISSTPASDILQKFNLTSLDIARFQSLKIQNMSLVEDREYGLALNVDFTQWTLYISKNWSQWPQWKCMTEECYTASRVTMEDIPSEEKSIGIADAFIRDYQINLWEYGKPRIIQQEWRMAYMSAVKAGDSSTAYIPDTLFVLYPQLIDGKEIYEEYGGLKGIQIGIDVKSLRVSDVSGIEKIALEAASYTLEWENTKLLEIAAKWGRSGYMYPFGDTSAKKREVRLGEPTLAYSRLYDYRDNMSSELLVPALVFPVLDTPKDGEWFNTQVVVPLVKDFFEVPGGNPAVPFPLPALPMAR